MYTEKEKEYHRIYGAKHYQEHKAEYALRIKNNVAKNRDASNKRQYAWRKKNRDRLRPKEKQYSLEHPLIKKWSKIQQRCSNPKNRDYAAYGAKGILCLLTVKDFEFLWNRDGAFLMREPSIHRLNDVGNYTIENCQFIEMDAHRRITKHKKT